MKTNRYYLLFLILVIAIFLRTWNLFSVPPSPSLDEVSIGYNAYSILNTGADEYGTKFPLLLRAYDDWRPALYVYLVVPFVKLFGLSTLSVRLPSATLSVLTVLAVYFLVKRVGKELGLKWEIAPFAATLLTISPWHIYISRLGHEANAGLAFFVFALAFLLRRNIYLTALFFTLSFISYQAEKVFLPVFLLGVVILFRKEIMTVKKKAFLACICSLILLLPFIKQTFSPNALIRFEATSIFNSQKDRFDKQTKSLALAVEKGDRARELLYNRRVLAGQIFLENYVAHFNPKWLFTNSSADSHKVPALGLFYPWEGLLMLFGLFFLFRAKIDIRYKIFFLFWILVSPLAGAITTDAPHAMRTYTLIPAPQILGAYGFSQLLLIMKKWRYWLYIYSLVVLTFSIWYFSWQYFVIFPKTQSSSFQYALSQAIPDVLENQNKYDKVIFSNQDNLYQSYMFFLFHSSYDPILYQKEGGTVSGGFAEIHKFGKFEFRSIDWEKDEADANCTLYVGNPDDFPSRVAPFKTISNLDGKEAIKIIEKKI